MARVVDTIYQEQAFSFASTWLVAIAYLLQIYYDFSGYSDMAIGLGQKFGFHFLENFDKPLTATSVQDFGGAGILAFLPGLESIYIFRLVVIAGVRPAPSLTPLSCSFVPAFGMVLLGTF